MITRQLQYIIEKYKITKTNNIIYGTNIPMPNTIIPTPWKTYIKFDQVERYFFYFDEKGITIYPINGETYATIPWLQVTNFQIKHLFILGKMMIQTKDTTYQFQMNRYVIGCSWIKRNTEYLEDYHYFYHFSCK